MGLITFSSTPGTWSMGIPHHNMVCPWWAFPPSHWFPIASAGMHFKGKSSSSRRCCPVAWCLSLPHWDTSPSEAVVPVNPSVCPALQQLYCALIFNSSSGCVLWKRETRDFRVCSSAAVFLLTALWQASKEAISLGIPHPVPSIPTTRHKAGHSQCNF